MLHESFMAICICHTYVLTKCITHLLNKTGPERPRCNTDCPVPLQMAPTKSFHRLILHVRRVIVGKLNFSGIFSLSNKYFHVKQKYVIKAWKNPI